MATTSFVNATGNGANRWRSLSYIDLSNAYDRGVALQPAFANINTDDPDLLNFAARGGKLLVYHGMADVLVPPQGTLNYYDRVQARVGGHSVTRNFYRLFLVPGMSHGFSNGTTNSGTNPPLPTVDQLYGALTDWVENRNSPDRIDVSAPATPSAPTSTRPLCLHPAKATYIGGNPQVASSYTCA